MGFRPDLDDQLISFSALTVGLVIWPVKIVPEMTSNVLSWTLNLYTTIHTITHSTQQHTVMNVCTILRQITYNELAITVRHSAAHCIS